MALAARPASAWFLLEEQREWLQARQDQEQARRQADLAKSGKAWGKPVVVLDYKICFLSPFNVLGSLMRLYKTAAADLCAASVIRYEEVPGCLQLKPPLL